MSDNERNGSLKEASGYTYCYIRLSYVFVCVYACVYVYERHHGEHSATAKCHATE
jgi:hypothetical protein